MVIDGPGKKKRSVEDIRKDEADGGGLIIVPAPGPVSGCGRPETSITRGLIWSGIAGGRKE